MDIILRLIIFSFFIYSCKLNNNNTNLVVRSELVNVDTNSNIIKVRLYVKNISDVNIGYWEKKCSWQDNWRLIDTNLIFISPNCDSNFPFVKYIKPNDSVIYNSNIIYKDNFKANKFQLVFNFIDSNIALDSVLKIYENENILSEISYYVPIDISSE